MINTATYPMMHPNATIRCVFKNTNTHAHVPNQTLQNVSLL